MSKRSGDQPSDGPLHPLGQAPGRPRLQSLLRYDVEDDPGHGASLYEAIVGQDTTQLSSDGWLDRLEAIERIKSRLDALGAEAVAGFDDSLRGVSADLGHRYPVPGDRDATAGERRWVAGDLRSVSDEIALILELRRGNATTRIHRSCELVHNFPATLAALRQGFLTERAAFTIVSELSVLDDFDELRAAEAAILDWAATHPLADIKLACQREAARRSPEATDKAYQRAHDERSVRMYPDGTGRATLVHNQSAPDAAAVITSLTRAAIRRRRLGDPRSLDQLRADIAIDRLLPRTKTTTNPPTSPEPVDDTTHDPAVATAHEPVEDTSYRPTGDTGDGPVDDTGYGPIDDDHWSADDPPGDVTGGFSFTDADSAVASDAHVMDHASVGAEATVVIHATGAELLALINGEVSTGGEADHHGPIPQSSLRKYLLKALAQTLLPNLPTTPNNNPRRSGAATHRNRTSDNRARTNAGPHTTNTDAGTTPVVAPAPAAATSRAGGSRIELQITDQPPPSNPNRYTPSPALDRYVRLRDRTCQFPGCNRPAEFADLDHRIPFAADGRTSAANLWCLCRHHHRLKHEGGWQIHPNPDGSWTWTSPIGRHYRNNPTLYHPPPNPTG